MSLLVLTENGKLVKKNITVAEASTAADLAGKTVIVNSAQAVSTTVVWPEDRTLEVKEGGVITVTGSLTINGPFIGGLYQCFSGTDVTFGPNAVAVASPYWWGFKQGGIKADEVSTLRNANALNYAFVAAAAAGSGGTKLYIPGGAYFVGATVATLGVPFFGDGPERTKLYPTGDFALFDVTLEHGESGNLTINYGQAGTLTSAGVALKLKTVSQCRLHNFVIWAAYYGVTVNSGYGAGAIWQVDFDHFTFSGTKDYAFYIDSAANSTTLAWHNCHVGETVTGSKYKGWYLRNVTTKLFSNCSIDEADGDMHGSAINDDQGFSLNIDTFHCEKFIHTTGGTSCSPFLFRSTNTKIDNIYMPEWTIDTGAGVDAILMMVGQGSSSFVLGEVEADGGSPIITSGNKKYASLSGCASAQILSGKLDKVDFVYYQYGNRYNFAKDTLPNTYYLKNVGGILGRIFVQTSQVAIINVPVMGANNSSGMFTVHGSNQSTGVGFFDLIAVLAVINGSTTVEVLSTKDSGAVPVRTYAWDNTNKNITLALASSSSYVLASGFAMTSDN